jgi:hypothetical protein
MYREQRREPLRHINVQSNRPGQRKIYEHSHDLHVFLQACVGDGESRRLLSLHVLSYGDLVEDCVSSWWCHVSALAMMEGIHVCLDRMVTFTRTYAVDDGLN